MSNRYKGGIISATPPTTTGGESGTASGAWTLEQQMQAQAAGLWPIQPPPPYIEDVFSTWLYTGNGSSQTITNGINLSGKGGLVWGKARSQAYNNRLFDTDRGGSNSLISNSTGATSSFSGFITSFNNDGFSIGTAADLNENGTTYASWTFRKQPKFFDVVTWTGNNTSSRAISHNLASTPGAIFIKKTSDAQNWAVYHRSTGMLCLNSTAAADAIWNGDVTNVNSATFTVENYGLNDSGATYVAYLFAHDAGGFGLSGEDNVISCGSFTTDGSGNATVNLGYEPQYILMKKTSGVQNWVCYDTMRGWAQAQQAQLYPNITQAEDMYTGSPYFFPTATGFSLSGTFGLGNNDTFIYIAIRRGPMKVPESGTEVFSPVARTGTGATANVTTSGFAGDLVISKDRGSSGFGWGWSDKLRGAPQILSSDSTNSEASYASYTDGVTGFLNTGYTLGADGSFLFNASGYNYGQYYLRRAPSVFDVVCYTGTGTSGRAIPHNLAAVPELIICKQRSTSSGTRNWIVYAQSLGVNKYLYLNDTAAAGTISNIWGTQTTTTFGVENFAEENDSGQTFVAYLFASAPGVSKVGSYTGTGTTQTIDCGFTAGSRFVLIKRTDSTGDWYVWDSARGIVAGDDPYLLLNSTAAEVTSTDYIDTTSVGFEISSTAPAAINASGGSFIFLAIA